MEIPKYKTTRITDENGITYIKRVDVRFPMLSYVVSLPSRALFIAHMLMFSSRMHRKGKPGSEAESASPQGRNEQPLRELDFGPVVSRSIPFDCLVQGCKAAGQYSVHLAHVSNDPVDGADVLEFRWRAGSLEASTYHTPEFFLAFLCRGQKPLFGRFVSEVRDQDLKAFSDFLVVREAKALVDDSSYETVRISGQNFEIRLKYVGLRASLAVLPDEPGHVLVLLSGVMDEDDILESFIIRVPLEMIAASSTSTFDEEEQAWVPVGHV